METKEAKFKVGDIGYVIDTDEVTYSVMVPKRVTRISLFGDSNYEYEVRSMDPNYAEDDDIYFGYGDEGLLSEAEAIQENLRALRVCKENASKRLKSIESDIEDMEEKALTTRSPEYSVGDTAYIVCNGEIYPLEVRSVEDCGVYKGYQYECAHLTEGTSFGQKRHCLEKELHGEEEAKRIAREYFAKSKEELLGKIEDIERRLSEWEAR